MLKNWNRIFWYLIIVISGSGYYNILFVDNDFNGKMIIIKICFVLLSYDMV